MSAYHDGLPHPREQENRTKDLAGDYRCQCGGLRHKCDMEEIERLKHDLGRAIANHAADLSAPERLQLFTEWAAGAACDDEYAPQLVERIAAMAKDALGQVDEDDCPRIAP